VTEGGWQFSKTKICRFYGVSRQAFYKKSKVVSQRLLKEEIVIEAVGECRSQQPRVGGRKLQLMLLERGFAIARDELFDLLRKRELLVRPRKNYKKTTNSYHRFRKYSNLIKDRQVNAPNQVFVSDITYLDTLDGFCYLALITDLYSRKIVGWDLSQSLGMESCLRALKSGLSKVPNPEKLTHHSDRGFQYCSYAYTGVLIKKNVQISMTEENHVYENAVAERLNGILKSEFLLGEKLKSFEHALKLTNHAIETYNEKRLHTSLNYQTPSACYAA
jgi:putative transposase